MPRLLVRIEAVNFDSSIFDTEDLSTIRGGSYANLLAPRAVLDAVAAAFPGRLALGFTGASQGVGILDVPNETVEHLEQVIDELTSGRRDLPGDNQLVRGMLPHLTVLGVAVAIDADYGSAARCAVARLRAKQLGSPSIDLDLPPDPKVREACSLDGNRGGRDSDAKGKLSRSVRLRREFGRALRQDVYGQILPGAVGLPEFAESFKDLVTPAPPGLPPALSNKFAIIHIDGNKFTKIRETAMGEGDGAAAIEARFSKVVKQGRARFLQRMIETFSSDPKMWCGEKLRFETLVWGGDESIFVIPAWKTMDLVRLLCDELSSPGWSFDGQRLTHSIGVLVCHYKTAIATAKGFVAEVLESAKIAAHRADHALSFQVLEGLEPQAGTLENFRKRLYGTGQAPAFALVGVDRMREFASLGERLTHPATGFPRSQLANVMTAVRRGSDLHVAIRLAVERSTAEDFDVAVRQNDLTSPLLGQDPTVPHLGLLRLAELWEIFRPFPAAALGAAA